MLKVNGIEKVRIIGKIKIASWKKKMMDPSVVLRKRNLTIIEN